MTVTYTGNLKLGLPTTGTESGTWGDVVNNQITTLVDQSISGTVSLTSMTNADYTLTNGNGNAANEARYMALLVPSSLTLTAARNIIVPSTSKMYVVKNATTGGFSVTVKTSAGTGVEVPNGNEMLLYCDGTNVVVAFDTINVNSVNGGQLAGLRNRIINGGMMIDQRNAGAAVTTATIGVPVYMLDRWAYNTTIASKITVQQVADAPAGFKYSTKLSVAVQAAPSAGDRCEFRQAIEGQNIIDLGFGVATASTITVTLWVKGSIPGTYSCAIYNGTNNRSYIGTITVAAGWAKQTITLVADTTGTWATDNTVGLYFSIDLGSGTGYNGSASSWQAGVFLRTSGSVTFVNQTAGATLNITGVQLEIGSVATTFEQRPYGMELALCQRYLPAYAVQTGNSDLAIAVGQAYSTVNAVVQFPFFAQPRVAPTGISVSNNTHFSVINAAGTPVATTAVTFGGATLVAGELAITVASGFVAGNATMFRSGNAAAQILWTGCEL